MFLRGGRRRSKRFMALAGAVPLTLGLALAGSSGAAVTAPHFI
ncbi:MAG: hypothetical protein QOD44_1698, partial [Solirubrobacteraceae bacterium]|nr:hypothetical protein [Solirubrobacteraceae bacterium]